MINFNFNAKFITLTTGVLAIVFLITVVVFAWTEPTLGSDYGSDLQKFSGVYNGEAGGSNEVELTNGGIRFYNRYLSQTAETLFISDYGNVGIGTTSPYANVKLSVYAGYGDGVFGSAIYGKNKKYVGVKGESGDSAGVYGYGGKFGIYGQSSTSNGYSGYFKGGKGVYIDKELEVAGISRDGKGKVVCIKSDGKLGTCSNQPNANGVIANRDSFATIS